MAVELNFSGTKFYVDVDEASWTKAKQALGVNPQASHTAAKECCVVSKIIQAFGTNRPLLTCRAPTSADHDVILVLNGTNVTVDIKVLFPDVDLTARGVSAAEVTEGLRTEIDRAYAKEKGQGNICCFDLSYIGDAARQTLVGEINNSYPECITLEYDMRNLQLHFVWPQAQGLGVRPDKGLYVHKGNADNLWYKATSTF
ncbi:hypothetical protein E2493_19240 [Sphingomonas parva]|uniref:Uncharacterized protein n=1 Tax=Sphingomonas parva TaxID=2555898 RepID=A0A4Y8ZKS6_9SPHN|nr:hypothetical protein [Sphingomonas parva]TFI56620.1 hypothetical protein E2493_19240 [Sphingomonas parva]